MVILLGAFPYARGSGLGSPFHQGGGRLATAAAGITAAAAAVLIAGVGGLCILAGVSALASITGWAVAKMLGGLTGDVYGAANELTEVLVLIAVIALAPYGLIEPLHELLGHL